MLIYLDHKNIIYLFTYFGFRNKLIYRLLIQFDLFIFLLKILFINQIIINQ